MHGTQLIQPIHSVAGDILTPQDEHLLKIEFKE